MHIRKARVICLMHSAVLDLQTTDLHINTSDQAIASIAAMVNLVSIVCAQIFPEQRRTTASQTLRVHFSFMLLMVDVWAQNSP